MPEIPFRHEYLYGFYGLYILLHQIGSLEYEYVKSFLSWLHVLVSINFGLSWFYKRPPRFIEQSASFSISYYIFDTLLLVGSSQKRRWPYVLHHIFAILLGIYTLEKEIPIHAMVPYMFTIELSNLFFAPWNYLRYRKHPYASKLLPWNVATYIPLRSFVLPYFSYNMMRIAWQHPVPSIRSSQCILYGALQGMSWLYSIQLIRIFRRQKQTPITIVE